MTTWARVTIGWLDFVLPATKGQQVFELLQGAGISSEYLTGDIAEQYGIESGDRFKEKEHRVACVLMSDAELHKAWERQRIHTLYHEREALEAELAKGWEADDTAAA